MTFVSEELATSPDDLSVHEESTSGMDVDAGQGASSSTTGVAEGPFEFTGDANFVPRRDSYRTSHEDGALKVAMSLGVLDFDDDEESLLQ